MLPCESAKHFLHGFWLCALQNQVCIHNLIIQFSDSFCTRKRPKITRPRPRNNVRRETPKKATPAPRIAFRNEAKVQERGTKKSIENCYQKRPGKATPASRLMFGRTTWKSSEQVLNIAANRLRKEVGKRHPKSHTSPDGSI